MTIPYILFMKHAEKVSKTASSSRSVLKGVYHSNNGDLVVTDAHRMYLNKDGNHRKDGAVIDPKTGNEIEGKYPDTSRLIPTLDPLVNVTFEVITTLKAVKALKSCGQIESKRAIASLVKRENKIYISVGEERINASYELGTLEDGEMDDLHLDIQYIVEALELFKEVGFTSVTMKTYGSMRPVILENEDLLALIMPIRKNIQ